MKVTAFLLCLLALSHAFNLPRKNLAGLPSEFAMHRLPEPTVGAMTEKGAFLYIDLQDSHWESPLFVDSASLFVFAIFSPLADSLDFVLTNPSGQVVPLEDKTTETYYPVGSERFPCKLVQLNEPQVGQWKLSASSRAGVVLSSDDLTPQGAVITFSESPIKAWTHLMTYHLVAGDRVGLVSRITTDSQTSLGVIPSATPDVIYQAYMEVLTPQGVQITVPMHDDGLNADELANDGIYGGSIPATETGTYTATATLRGKTADGVEFMRTTEHVIPVVTNEIDFTGQTFISMTEPTHINIHFGVETPDLPKDHLFRAYAEVYGTSITGEEVAICWLSAMVNPEEVAGQTVVTLEMDLSWAVKAAALPPYSVKNVYIQDAYVYIPLDTLDVSSVAMTATQTRRLSQLPKVPSLEVTREMKVGRVPAEFNLTRSSVAAPTLMMVHGYCSDGNPFPTQHFTNAAFFSKPKANLSNQNFTKEVAAYAATLSMDAYSIIGHSQGGMVGLHLYNSFWSGMDRTTSGKKIQSLGTPFLGCTGAGSAANLIKMFGYGCGTNTDLTVDGAQLWLAGISAEARSEVYFYTTTYKLGNLFGDYCNAAVNLVLEWPNDGVTELEYTNLPKGTNMGNTQKQCHTSGMGYMAQYDDQTRNAAMNSFAAR
eukprot:TRINITY_DN1957_c0_g1_i1.p1 TRINITY_DN1957_c0_g1~~TRINITY_DN1957_c0_g1_i1.p1  ORF type:complete len:654 (-),score=206.29 TRINITY_DN1957_c0_g1_i1:114-2075(-)